MSNDGFEPQITWLHVSDIHAGSGGLRDQAELAQVFADLLRDLGALVHAEHVQPPTHVIFTGDVSQSGGGDPVKSDRIRIRSGSLVRCAG